MSSCSVHRRRRCSAHSSVRSLPSRAAAAIARPTRSSHARCWRRGRRGWRPLTATERNYRLALTRLSPLASPFHHSATPPPALAARRRRRRLRAPTELIVRLEFVPEARLGLGGHASRFKQGPDL